LLEFECPILDNFLTKSRCTDKLTSLGMHLVAQLITAFLCLPGSILAAAPGSDLVRLESPQLFLPLVLRVLRG
jgi:hypothetical protein